jgi:hypothetical protein
MLKQCTALLLLVAFMAASFSKAVIIADFYANQDQIAKTLCVNKGNPGMHCCGRCQLRKRLSHEANQDQNNPERRIDDKEVLFVEDASTGIPAPDRLMVSVPFGELQGQPAVDQPANIDHPPA